MHEHTEELQDAVIKQSCDQYIFSGFVDEPLSQTEIPDNALTNIELLKSLEEQGVTVLMTWGFVVDRPGAEGKCYESSGSQGSTSSRCGKQYSPEAGLEDPHECTSSPGDRP